MAILLTGTRVCSLISTTKIVVSNGATDPSPIRLINDISPVKGAFNPAMNCGPNARKAQVVAPAKPGSKMSFFWASGQPSEPWPHNIGPMITYMARAPSDITEWQPGTSYVSVHLPFTHILVY